MRAAICKLFIIQLHMNLEAIDRMKTLFFVSAE